jgi:hypothetical protein
MYVVDVVYRTKAGFQYKRVLDGLGVSLQAAKELGMSAATEILADIHNFGVKILILNKESFEVLEFDPVVGISIRKN